MDGSRWRIITTSLLTPFDTLGAQAVGGVLDLEGAAVGGADEEDVLRAGVGAAGRDVRQASHVDAVDLVVQVPGVSGGSADDQDETRATIPRAHHSLRCRLLE